MLTTAKLLAALKKANGNCSDYRVAKILKVTTATVSRWNCNLGPMSEETAKKAAELLGFDPVYVVACIHAEQQKGKDIYPVWKDLCHRLEREQKAA
jgi:hypothetical protein